ncbi:MAG: RsmD family RNA methyltransferase [Chloroflexota bacterium]|nr:RsmD family RNA methyltransferase [Chloroflexota bacterium]
MRVIAGSARGRPLKGPPSAATRPMANKIKGSLFSMLASLGVEPIRVLDLYAGTGGIGIEALSRGAEWVDFVERNAAASAVIRANIATAGFTEAARVHQLPVASFLNRAEPAYDFIILDPPYADPEIVRVLTRLGSTPLVQSDTIVAIGHSPRAILPERAGKLIRFRQRCHGDSCYSLYEMERDLVDNANGEDQPA